MATLTNWGMAAVAQDYKTFVPRPCRRWTAMLTMTAASEDP